MLNNRRLQTARVLALAFLVSSVCAPAFSAAYCDITEVKVEPLSNGVQITITADGRLDWRGDRQDYVRSDCNYSFTNARLALDETFYQVDSIPVSYVQFVTSPEAIQGIGVDMTMRLSEPAEVRATEAANMQSIIITVTTQTPVGNGGNGEKKPTSTTGDKFLSVESENGLLTVRAIKADIHEVVAKIAREGGINIAVDDLVKHDVSLNIVNAPPLVVLQGIASGYGLALSQAGDVVMISEGVLKEKDLATYNRSATTSFPITYLEADQAASLLPNFLNNYLRINGEQNAVVCTAPSQMLAKIGSDLNAVDVAPPVIMVDALVVEVSKSGEMNRRLRLRYADKETDASTNSGTGDVVYEKTELPEVSTAIAENAVLTADLRALLSRGDANIRANPRMAAVNGRNAEIFIGAQRFIKISFLQYGQQVERIQGVPVGVRLNVTPWTGGNGEITTTLSIEVSNISSIDPETGLPALSTRTASSTVRTRDGETIVIGGLKLRQIELTKRKIPILGDIPFIGELFRSSATSSADTELLIFVTPRLLDDRGRQSEEVEKNTREQFLGEGEEGGGM